MVQSLLRHPEAKSSFEEFAAGTYFRPFYPEVSNDLVEDSKVRRVLLCSGKVYYDLADKRKKAGVNDVAICRASHISGFCNTLTSWQCGGATGQWIG